MTITRNKKGRLRLRKGDGIVIVHTVQEIGRISMQTELSPLVDPQKEGQPPGKVVVNTINRDDEKGAYIFATDFPTGFLLVKSFGKLVAFETDDDITLNGAERADFRGSCSARHGTNGDIKRCRRRGSAVVCEFAVI